MLGRIGAVLLLGTAVALGATAPAWAGGKTERISVGPGGVQGDDFSAHPEFSAGRRFVAFEAQATNLVPGDRNGLRDVFVRDLKTGKTERVSLGPGGIQGNGESFVGPISADGRFVAFISQAANLVAGDTNGVFDVFVRDRTTGKTERVSVSSKGAQGNGASGAAFRLALSANGRFVAFRSFATNLVAGDTNGQPDVFVHDRRTGKTERVSVGLRGAQATGPSFASALSADGRFVAFNSLAANLVKGDTNDTIDVFVRDRTTGKTVRVSVGPGGGQSNAPNGDTGLALSADGRLVAFSSDATNLVKGDTNGTTDVFVHR